MNDTPSTRSFLFRAAFQTIGFVLVWRALDAIWWHGRETLAWAIAVGSALATIDMAGRYRRSAWRKAVAPVHAFGAATAGLAILLTAFLQTPSRESVNIWLRAGGAVLLGAAPAYVMALSARELWRRRTDG